MSNTLVWKNTIFVEIPSFINKSMYSDIDGVYKMNSNLKEQFEDLIEEMEDSQEYYIGWKEVKNDN